MSSRTADLTGLALPAAGAIAGGGCAVVLYLVNPHSHQVFVPCPFHAATGLYCPACGGLRMMHDLLHGDLTAALHDDALAMPAVIIGFAAWLYWSICRWRGRPAPARPTWLSPVIIAVLIVWTVVRNLPWAPFAALRPTALCRLRYLGALRYAGLACQAFSNAWRLRPPPAPPVGPPPATRPASAWDIPIQNGHRCRDCQDCVHGGPEFRTAMHTMMPIRPLCRSRQPAQAGERVL